MLHRTAWVLTVSVWPTSCLYHYPSSPERMKHYDFCQCGSFCKYLLVLFVQSGFHGGLELSFHHVPHHEILILHRSCINYHNPAQRWSPCRPKDYRPSSRALPWDRIEMHSASTDYGYARGMSCLWYP